MFPCRQAPGKGRSSGTLSAVRRRYQRDPYLSKPGIRRPGVDPFRVPARPASPNPPPSTLSRDVGDCAVEPFGGPFAEPFLAIKNARDGERYNLRSASRGSLSRKAGDCAPGPFGGTFAWEAAWGQAFLGGGLLGEPLGGAAWGQAFRAIKNARESERYNPCGQRCPLWRYVVAEPPESEGLGGL